MIILSTRAAHQFGRWLRFICGAKTSGSVFIPGALPLAIDDALSGLNNVNKQVTNLSLMAMGDNLSQTHGIF
jgi:hypothetical protein